jgi:fatty-acid peroxygenase
MIRRPRLDDSLPMLAKGYAWLPDRRRAADRDTVHARLMLARQALGVAGPDGARFVYDEDHVRRSGALPEPVVSTLFGHGSVHSLDGEAHRVRKAMFVDLLTGSGVADLVDRVGAAWDDAVRRWAGEHRVVLFDQVARVLTRGVCDWAAVPVTDEEVPALARDLTTLVDGFATGAPRHWRARRVRQRREAWLAAIVEDVRSGARTAPPRSALDVVSTHRDSEGELLDPRVAAVELLNVIRPTVAVCWFVAFAAHALHRWPANRDRLRAGHAAFATAFAHEVRRYYPFAPFIGGRAPREVEWDGERVPAGSMVLLDLFGQNHDPDLFPEPYAFRPERFLTDDGDRLRPIGPWELVPQGAGDPRTGHRCPGEDITVALLSALAVRLARLDYALPDQDLSISLRRIPARPASRVVMTAVRPD